MLRSGPLGMAAYVCATVCVTCSRRHACRSQSNAPISPFPIPVSKCSILRKFCKSVCLFQMVPSLSKSDGLLQEEAAAKAVYDLDGF